jgi:hypothetical protein
MSLILGILDSGGAAAGGGTAYESIATVTVGSGGASEVNFSSIPATYTHLQIRGIFRGASGGLDLNQFRINTDTGSNYATHLMQGLGTSVDVSERTANTSCINGDLQPGSSSTANTFGASVIDILDYANTNKYKVVRHLGGVDMNGTGRVDFGSGVWLSTSAITAFRIFTFGVNFAEYSQFALYGIKGA